MKKLKIRKAFAPGEWGDRNPILGVCLPLYLLPIDEVINVRTWDPSMRVWMWGRCCVPAWHLWGHPRGSLSFPDSRLGKEQPHPPSLAGCRVWTPWAGNAAWHPHGGWWVWLPSSACNYIGAVVLEIVGSVIFARCQ